MTGRSSERATPGHRLAAWAAATLLLLTLPGGAGTLQAHGPIFSPGPHTPFQGAYEPHISYHRAQASGAGREETEQELEASLGYGVTADWELVAEVPYVRKEENGERAEGLGDLELGTRYRFLRKDLPHAQRSATALLRVKLPTGDPDTEPRLGTGSTDYVAGLAAGHEGRRWYGFVSAVSRFNGKGADGLRQGDRQTLSVAGGVRPWLTGYEAPDWVFLLELNGEIAARDERNGRPLENTGGREWFASPGLFLTYRNLALRTGVQWPLAHDLNGDQARTDYRFLLSLEAHL